MGGSDRSTPRRRVFIVAVSVILLLGVLQSVVHLAVVLGAHRTGTVFDLDRSNGLPDLVSTCALALAAVGAGLLARVAADRERVAATALTVGLAFLAVADLAHAGAHPTPLRGKVVIVVVVVVVVLLFVVAGASSPRTRGTLVVATLLLLGSMVVNSLDHVDRWFQRERLDPVVEYQIVAKEGLELLGWSLVALALLTEAARRADDAKARVPVTRAPAQSRRRAA